MVRTRGRGEAETQPYQFPSVCGWISLDKLPGVAIGVPGHDDGGSTVHVVGCAVQFDNVYVAGAMHKIDFLAKSLVP